MDLFFLLLNDLEREENKIRSIIMIEFRWRYLNRKGVTCMFLTIFIIIILVFILLELASIKDEIKKNNELLIQCLKKKE